MSDILSIPQGRNTANTELANKCCTGYIYISYDERGFHEKRLMDRILVKKMDKSDLDVHLLNNDYEIREQDRFLPIANGKV